MRKAGIKDYRAFAKDMVRLIPDRPLSFEVFSDDFRDMELKKMKLVDDDLTAYSLDTVKMFYNDARQAGFLL